MASPSHPQAKHPGEIEYVNTKDKNLMKKLADSRVYVHESPLQVGDAVIIKREG